MRNARWLGPTGVLHWRGSGSHEAIEIKGAWAADQSLPLSATILR
jgi:hypothetical protein